MVRILFFPRLSPFRITISIIITFAAVIGLCAFPRPGIPANGRTPAGSSCIAIGSGTTYAQNFDTLANSGTSSAVPAGWLFSEALGSANTIYSAGTGSATTGDTYSFGAAASTDRAFGGLQSGSLLPTIGACFVNNTGSQVSELSIAYDGEQWRLGATGRTDRLDFEYSLDATSLTTGTWIPYDPLDFAAPVSTGPTGALDGNVTRASVSGNITGLALDQGSTIYIRYLDHNATGSDDGLGVDNFTLAAVQAPGYTIELSAAGFAEDESQTLVVTVLRNGSGNGTSSVQLTTGSGTATPGSCGSGGDYQTQNATVIFNGLDTTATVDIPICPDLLREVVETFTISLTAPVNATLGPIATATANIRDAASQFANTTPIPIVDGSVTASQIVVSGSGSVGTMRVTIFDLDHAFADDINIVLVAPAGQSYVLIADSGGANPVGPGTTLTFSDHLADFMPDSTPVGSGGYKPTSWSPLPTVLPSGPPPPYFETGPGGGRPELQMNTVFGGLDPNGTWTLFIYSDGGAPIAGPGTVAGGWGLETLAPSAAALSLSGRVLDASGRGIRNAIVMLEGGNLPAARFTVTGSFGQYGFGGLSSGTYLVSVHSGRHTFTVSSRSISMSESITDADFGAEPLR